MGLEDSQFQTSEKVTANVGSNGQTDALEEVETFGVLELYLYLSNLLWSVGDVSVFRLRGCRERLADIGSVILCPHPRMIGFTFPRPMVSRPHTANVNDR